MTRFNGKFVLVTGAASGIGRAAARRLAQEGAALILADRDAHGLAATAQETNAQNLVYDAGIPGASAAMAAQAGALHGRLDAVLNIAGIYTRGHAEEVSAADWGRILQINLTSVFEICQGAFPALKAARGAVINTSSTAAWMETNTVLTDQETQMIKQREDSLALESGMRTQCATEFMKAEHADLTGVRALAEQGQISAERAQQLADIIRAGTDHAIGTRLELGQMMDDGRRERDGSALTVRR